MSTETSPNHYFIVMLHCRCSTGRIISFANSSSATLLSAIAKNKRGLVRPNNFSPLFNSPIEVSSRPFQSPNPVAFANKGLSCGPFWVEVGATVNTASNVHSDTLSEGKRVLRCGPLTVRYFYTSLTFKASSLSVVIHFLPEPGVRLKLFVENILL